MCVNIQIVINEQVKAMVFEKNIYTYVDYNKLHMNVSKLTWVMTSLCVWLSRPRSLKMNFKNETKINSKSIIWNGKCIKSNAIQVLQRINLNLNKERHENS